MKPSEHISHLEAELDTARKRIAYLAQVVAAGGLDTFEIPPQWATLLSRGEYALMSALIDAHPKAMSAYGLDELIPKRDRAAERDVKIIGVLVSGIRKKLGHDVIENIWGEGWRCSPAVHERLQAAAPQDDNHRRTA